jgi:hypothetical protein
MQVLISSANDIDLNEKNHSQEKRHSINPTRISNHGVISNNFKKMSSYLT